MGLEAVSLEQLQTSALSEQQRAQSRRYSLAPPTQADLCHAVDLACVFYFKQVMCLQRLAATTLLFRRHGWEAEMVIGAQVLPFKSHTWVEIKGAAVNDKPYMMDMYRVLERC
jgi:Transglutaminase-like superfamily